MSNTAQRIILFIVAIPLLTAMALYDFGNNLLINLFLLYGAFFGAFESAKLIKGAGLSYSHWVPWTSFLVALSAYIQIAAWIPLPLFFRAHLFYMVSALGFVATLFSTVIHASFHNPANLRESALQTAGDFFVLIYPGYFVGYGVLLGSLPSPYHTPYYLYVILVPALSDSLAYLMGRLFGKGNRGIVPVSPNKSLAGFAGEILASTGAVVILYYVFKVSFGSIPLSMIIIFGILSGVALIIGDLAESIFKRAAGVKDSGHAIPGRGGMLDSLDSGLFVAPLCYFSFLYLLTQYPLAS